MSRKVLNAFLHAAVFFALIQPVSFAQDVSPAAHRFKLKSMHIKGIHALSRISEWVKIDDSSSVAFIEDNSESTNTTSIYSLPISSKGKLGSTTKLIQVSNGWFDKPSAVWIPGQNRGLVFVPYATDYGPLKVDVIPFDKDGNKLAAPVNLMTFNPPANNWVQFCELQAIRGTYRIGIFAGVSYWQQTDSKDHYSGCTVRFLSTGLNGNPASAALTIPLPANGKLQAVVMDDATFNYGRFLAPMIITNYETYNATPAIEYGRPVKSTLYIFSAAQNTSKVSDILMKPITDFTKDYFSFPYIALESPNRFILFYGTVNFIPSAKVKLDKYEDKKFTQTIDSFGNKIGKAKKIKMPVWKHKITYDPAKSIMAYAIINSDAFMAEDGTVYISQTFCLRRVKYGAPISSSDYEELFRLLNINPKTGKVKIESQLSDKKDFFFLDPLMLNFGRNLIILNQGIPYLRKETATSAYLSKIRAKKPLQ